MKFYKARNHSSGRYGRSLSPVAAALFGLLVFLAGAAQSYAPTGDPLLAVYYGLEVEGHFTGFFTEASGIGSETEVVEMKVIVGTVEVVRKIPGRLRWSDITLKRGITSNTAVWTWRRLVETGDIAGARANCTITMYDQAATPIARWTITNAWPSKISAPSVLGDSDFAVEELTIVHEGYTRTL